MPRDRVKRSNRVTRPTAADPCNQGSAGFRLHGMRHLGVVVGTGILMLLVAGCAGGGSTASVQPGSGLSVSSTTAPSSPVSPVLPGTQVPAGATPVPDNQVKASALPSQFPRTVWFDKGGTELGFYGLAGGCFTSNATVVQQTDAQVIVRVVQQQPGTGTRACPMYVRYKPMTVALAKPLGARTVVLQLSIVRG